MRILVADGQSRVRLALHAMLEEQPGLRVVRQVAASWDLRVQVEVTCPDLLLLSWELPD